MSFYPTIFLILSLFLSHLTLLLVKRNYTNRNVNSRQSILTDSGQLISFILSSQTASLFHGFSSEIWAANLTIGCLIGYYLMYINGSEVPSAGLFLGGLAAIMGTMIGLASNDPTICGLSPSTLPFPNSAVALGFISVLVLFFLNVFLARSLSNYRR